MKALLVALLILSSSAALAQGEDCKRCDEIAALEKKVKEELPKEQPDTGAYDVEAAKIINSLDKLNDAQAKQIVSYLRYTLPTDPSRSIIESLWPTLSKNMPVIQKAALTRPKGEEPNVWNAILHHEEALKHGQDEAQKKTGPAKKPAR